MVSASRCIRHGIRCQAVKVPCHVRGHGGRTAEDDTVKVRGSQHFGLRRAFCPSVSPSVDVRDIGCLRPLVAIFWERATPDPLPFAAEMALQTAGRIGGSTGSPRPVGALSVRTNWTSMTGDAFDDQLELVEVGLHGAAVLEGISCAMNSARPSRTAPCTWSLRARSGSRSACRHRPPPTPCGHSEPLSVVTVISATSPKWPRWLCDIEDRRRR